MTFWLIVIIICMSISISLGYSNKEKFCQLNRQWEKNEYVKQHNVCKKNNEIPKDCLKAFCDCKEDVQTTVPAPFPTVQTTVPAPFLTTVPAPFLTTVPAPFPTVQTTVPAPFPTTVPAPVQTTDPGGKLIGSNKGWDYAYFFSGIRGKAFTNNDIGTSNSPPGQLADGADASCKENPDLPVLKSCANHPYGKGLQSGINIKCKHSDGNINLVNPNDRGKILVHSGRTYGQDPIHAGFNSYCSISKYSVPKEIYEANLKKMEIIYRNCGKGLTTLWTTDKLPGIGSCLIKTTAFKQAGILLPEDDGRPRTSNGGVALSYGHGLGSGACGTVSLIQNGPEIDSSIQGNTIINYQIGTRSFSGEITDSFWLKDSKLDGAGSYYLIEAMQPPANTCSQPVFKNINHSKFTKLLDIVVNSIN